MVVVFVLGFFAASVLITGVQNRDNEKDDVDGGVIFALILTACFVLFCQIVAMVWISARNRDRNAAANNNNNSEPLLPRV